MPVEMVSTLAIGTVVVLLAISGWRGVPGLGIIGSLGVIAWIMWSRDSGLGSLGLVAPSSIAWTIGFGVACGILIQVLAVTVIEPISDRVTRSSHDHSVVESVRGSWLSLVQWLLVVWLIVALVEEVIFRGFVLNQISALLPTGTGTIIAVVISSVVFGLAHLYQGKSGALSTAIVGSVLGMLFVWAGSNLWLPIITHGVIDTAGILLIATDRERDLRRWGLGRFASP